MTLQKRSWNDLRSSCGIADSSRSECVGGQKRIGPNGLPFLKIRSLWPEKRLLSGGVELGTLRPLDPGLSIDPPGDFLLVQMLEKWDQVFSENQDLELKDKVDNKPLFKQLSEETLNESLEIEEIIDAYIVKK